MGYREQRTWVWHFDQPASAIWPLLADTARYNEAAKLPKHEIIETPQADGSVLYEGRARIGPFQVEWREEPVNWVSGRWFRHRRIFTKGPLASLCATCVFEPEGSGCCAQYTLEVESANLLGRAVLAAGFTRAAGETFARLAAQAGEHAAGQRPTAFQYDPPPQPPEVAARIAEMIQRIEASPHGHGLAERLARYLGEGQEVDLARIRPLSLARLWNRPERPVIELCLEATRAGLLELHWDILCPRCRVAKATCNGLDQLPRGAHCDTCNIDYDRDFSRNVELTFRPAPTIRPIAFGEYCLFGPMSTPHIALHITVPAGDSRDIAAELRPGAYRLRTLEPGPERDIEWDGTSGFPEVRLESSGLAAGEPAAPGSLRLTNHSDHERTLIVEERAWVRDALTADRATAFQAFRDLFSDQVLRPGDEVSVGRVALMFTDLSGSTALYGRVGDARAYHLVREHFAFLAGIVREHDGSIVKTIGDAVMAVFSEPANCLRAALAAQARVAEFNERSGAEAIRIKIGLHEGPCIAVNLNDRLDYFGSTVNLAARLQGRSAGGDIVISASMAAQEGVAALLAERPTRKESAELKGFDEPVPFLRLGPGGPVPRVVAGRA